ncbi:MAG: hypothetical protein V1904_12025 [Bacteroidota bacterium]
MRTFFKAVTLFFLFETLFVSCSSKHRHHSNDSDTSFVKGKVTELIKCRYDATQSYALYLPASYDKNKKWPIVYMFDPHGKGSLPLKKYSSIAEKFGYILIGSNNSKNGLSMNMIKIIFDTLYSDSHRKFSIDDMAVYAAGFSGGSRVASNLATYGKIKSVIGCGAAMSSTDANSANKFGYFGIVGNEDFNLTEMLAIKDVLDKTATPHCFTIFNGKHEWPPDSVMQQAFLWTDIQAMKKKIKDADYSIADTFYYKWTKEFEQIKTTDQYDAYLLCEKIISFFDGIKDVTTFKTILEELKKNATVITAIEKQKIISVKESLLRAEYTVAMNDKDTTWWKQQVAMINQQIKKASEKSTAQMYKRILNYLSLVAYMNASSTIKANNFDTAFKYVEIYSLVDPGNPEHAYLKASLLMKKGKLSDALASLENAAQLGFAESDRLERDTVMDRLRSLEKYSEILDSIKSNVDKEK